MSLGTVKFFNQSKGFSFINPEVIFIDATSPAVIIIYHPPLILLKVQIYPSLSLIIIV